MVYTAGQVRWLGEDAALSLPIVRPCAHDRSPVPHPALPPAKTPAGGRGIELMQRANDQGGKWLGR
eukprot:11712604-Alexandrium_andersonii.AAC.1